MVSAVVLLFAANTFLCSPTGVAPEIIDVTDIKILKLKSDSLKVNISVLALNKNNSDLKINDVHLNLMIDDEIIGTAIKSEEITMKKFNTSYIPICCTK